MLTRQEEAGAVFKDSQGDKDCIALMTASGCNCFRLRLFVNPTGKGGVVQDVPYTIALAKRIKASKGVLLLDFHYSDTWADPAHQSKPAAWKDLPFEELVRTVESYTAAVIAEFKTQEVLPDMVQIGNEIHPGFLWPDGKLGGPQQEPEQAWQRFAQLLKAGIRGVRAQQHPMTILRLSFISPAAGILQRQSGSFRIFKNMMFRMTSSAKAITRGGMAQ